MIIFLLDLLANAWRNQFPIHEVIVHNLAQKSLAYKIDHGRILDRRGLGIDARRPVHFRKIKAVVNAGKVDSSEEIERKTGREDIVHRMKNGKLRSSGIGGNDSSRHPVMTVEDQPTSAFRTEFFDDVVDDLALKFNSRQDRVARIRAHVVREDG